jgi:hypothetical protein
LREASAIGRFPTPIGDLMAAAKLTVVDDDVLDGSFLRRFIKKAKVLFWELFGVNLGQAGAGGVGGRDSGYCVITLPAA